MMLQVICHMGIKRPDLMLAPPSAVLRDNDTDLCAGLEDRSAGAVGAITCLECRYAF